MKALIFFLFLCPPCRALSAQSAKAADGKIVQPPAPQIFCIFGGQSGKPFGDLASFKSVIWKSDVVYAGGSASLNSSFAGPRLEVLKTMREARGSKIAVGFEALDMSLQPVLDDYAAGKITEEDFLRGTGLQEPGGGFAPYKPIFDFIIRNKLRALALNVPGNIVSKIAREGAAGLNDEEKKFLPAQINLSKHKKYLEFLKASFNGGAAAGAAGTPAWDNHLAAVSSWNEGAGARIADFINANPGWSVLVAAGNDRLIYNAALPSSVKNRTVKPRQASFYVFYADEAAKCPAALPKEHKNLANYIWYINDSTTVVSGQ